jgi:hypothetical protein
LRGGRREIESYSSQSLCTLYWYSPQSTKSCPVAGVVCSLVCTFRSSSFVRQLFPGPGEETRASPERKDNRLLTKSTWGRRKVDMRFRHLSGSRSAHAPKSIGSSAASRPFPPGYNPSSASLVPISSSSSSIMTPHANAGTKFRHLSGSRSAHAPKSIAAVPGPVPGFFVPALACGSLFWRGW